jgi:hypothetical protein
MKTVWIFSGHIWDRICLEGFRSVRIWVQIFNIWYRIHIRKLKLHIYDVDIESYPIWHGWHYLYLNPNPTKNIKTNIISMISIRIRSVFIPPITQIPSPHEIGLHCTSNSACHSASCGRTQVKTSSKYSRCSGQVETVCSKTRQATRRAIPSSLHHRCWH